MYASIPKKLKEIELFAWLGEDELGSGVVGLKIGLVPAGRIPLVATTEEKVDKRRDQMQAQALVSGKKIYLCRYQIVEVIETTESGRPLE